MGNIFEISDFNFDIEQVLNIGSQSSGATSGKVTFNPFTITRNSDRLSPLLFAMCCTGEHFQIVSLYLRRAGGQGGQAAVASAAGQGSSSATAASGFTFLRFDFALVAVKTISWSGSDGDEAMKEEVAFEYGALQARYVQQDVTGKPMTAAINRPQASWNRVNNNNFFPAVTGGLKAT